MRRVDDVAFEEPISTVSASKLGSRLTQGVSSPGVLIFYIYSLYSRCRSQPLQLSLKILWVSISNLSACLGYCFVCIMVPLNSRQIAYANAFGTMLPYDKEHDGSGRNSHRHDPKGKQREQTVCEEVSEGTTYQAYTYAIDNTESYHPPSHQGYSGHPKEYTSYLAPPYAVGLGSSSYYDSGCTREYTPYSIGLGSSSHCCSGHSTQIPFISPASASIGQSYVGCSSDYQPQPQEPSQYSDDATLYRLQLHVLNDWIAQQEAFQSRLPRYFTREI